MKIKKLDTFAKYPIGYGEVIVEIDGKLEEIPFDCGVENRITFDDDRLTKEQEDILEEYVWENF